MTSATSHNFRQPSRISQYLFQALSRSLPRLHELADHGQLEFIGDGGFPRLNRTMFTARLFVVVVVVDDDTHNRMPRVPEQPTVLTRHSVLSQHGA